MEGRENASIIDLKMGTSTITCNIVEKPHRIEKRLKKDKQTTSQKLGLKVIGYVIKCLNKSIDEKFYKFPYISASKVPDVLRRIFQYPKASCHPESVMQSHFPENGSSNHLRQSLMVDKSKSRGILSPDRDNLDGFNKEGIKKVKTKIDLLDIEEELEKHSKTSKKSNEVEEQPLNDDSEKSDKSEKSEHPEEESKDFSEYLEQQGQINTDAQRTILAELNRLLDFLENRS